MKVRIRKHQNDRQNEGADNQIFSARRTRAQSSASQLPILDQVAQESARDEAAETIAFLLAYLPQHPLPYRNQLELLFGRTLPADIRVVYGHDVGERLADLDVHALARGHIILLQEAEPSLPTLAHEVVHLLQVDPMAPVGEKLLPFDAPAEREAQELAAQINRRNEHDELDEFISLPVAAAIHPEALAASRADAPPAPVEDVQTAERDLAQELAVQQTEPPSGSEAPAPEAESETQSLDDLAPVDDLVEETLEPPGLPPVPEPGIDEADVAARREALAQAQAALEGAEDAKGTVDAFAAAPPSLKAREAGGIDGRISGKVTSEEQGYQENLPDFHAELNLQPEEAEANEVALPEQEEVVVESDDLGPSPDIDLPPTADHGDYGANDDVLSRVRALLDSWFGEDRAQQIGRNLRDVSTRDSEVSADPGEAPRVPLEGENDPQRIENQRDELSDQSRRKRDEAQQAVLDGPGPEQVQPRNMDEVIALGELEQPNIETNIDDQGPETYLQYGLPEEVDTAFDQDNAQVMEESFADAKTQVGEATDTRDRDRQTALDSAQSDAERLSEESDTEQRDQIVSSRNDIQSQRQTTLDTQRDAVRDAEGDLETRRAQDRSAIEDRVSADEETISNDYDQAERDAQAEIDQGERDAESEKRASEREAENQSWWDRAVNFVKRAFAALTAAINAIFDAVRAAINRVLDAVKEAATRLIRAAASFVKGAISAFGEFAKGVVNTLLADTFPGLAAELNERIDGYVESAHNAVDAVADRLIAGVNALVEGLRGALNAVLDAFQAAINTVLQIMQAALTGDWGAVIRLAFEAVLKVAGIDPEEVYAFIGRAMETINIILDAPLQFVGNLVNAVVGGVRQFADNILTHLQAGIIGWLTGALGPAGITLPAEFNLMGVLDIVRQVLGFTWENIRSRVVRIVGETAVQALEFAYGYVETLVNEGWQGLWDQIMNDLAGLRDMVFDQIKEFVLTRLVMAAVTRLATMFNPVGAIVNLIIMAYQLYTFLRDNIQRLVQLMQSVFDAIGDIARGVLAPAKDRVEGTLAQFLPLAIDLVARIIGLGNVSGRVRRILTRVQERIWGAVDRLIERVLGRFRGGEAGTGDGEAEATEGTGDQIGERLPISTPDGTHHLTIEVAGDDATFVVRSQRQTIDQLVTLWRGRVDTVAENDRTRARTLLDSLDTTENSSEQTVESILRADDEISPADQGTAVAEQRELVPILTGLFQIFGLEGVDVNVDVLFESILSQADENARPDLQSALSQHSDEVVDGENIRANWREAITDSDFYVRPLLQAHGLGRAARPPIVEQARLKFAQLQAAAPAGGRTIREPEDYNRFHASRVGMIHGTPRDPFSQSLRLVRDQIFQGNLGYTTNTGSQLYEEYRASIDRYVEGTPSPHGEYEPVLVESAEIDGATVHTYTYQRVRIQKQNGEVEEVTPPRFTATVRGGRVASISARGLRFKEILADVQSGQRGRMQSPPDYDSNLLLNRSHLVADEFMGSAYRNSGNVIVTSETYNQQDMREAERDISEIIGAHATRAAGGNADDLLERITFDMEISVDYANSVFDAQIRQEAENSILNILRQNDSIVGDVTELEQQWNDINSTLETKLHNVQPVRRVTYSVTANLDGNQLTAFSQRIGPDIYLGFAIGAVRAVFRAAAN